MNALAYIPAIGSSNEQWAAYQVRCDALDKAFRAGPATYFATASTINRDHAKLSPAKFIEKYS